MYWIDNAICHWIGRKIVEMKRDTKFGPDVGQKSE